MILIVGFFLFASRNVEKRERVFVDVGIIYVMAMSFITILEIPLIHKQNRYTGIQTFYIVVTVVVGDSTTGSSQSRDK